FVPLDVRVEVDPAAGRAEGAGLVGLERERDVGRVAATDGGHDLVVVDRPYALDLHRGVQLVEAVQHGVPDAELALAEAAPHGECDRLAEVRRRGGLRAATSTAAA